MIFFGILSLCYKIKILLIKILQTIIIIVIINFLGGGEVEIQIFNEKTVFKEFFSFPGTFFFGS